MLLRALVPAIGLAAALHATGPMDDAFALLKQKRYPEAQAALEKIVAADPKNAAACHELGLLWRKRDTVPHDNTAMENALKWLGQAAELEPKNADYVGDYGGTALIYAGRVSSLSWATKGREAMERAIALDPDDLDARDGLFQYYSRAPWPLGSSAKAREQLEEIRKRDPDRATVLAVIDRTRAKDYPGAFRLCDEVLARHPNDYTALYQYGRTASICGQNLERALEHLQAAAKIEQPSPATPSHSNVWFRIGLVQEKLGHVADAKAAYQTALKEDPNNRDPAAALERLK